MLIPEYTEALLELPASVRLTQNEIPIFEQAKANLLEGKFEPQLAEIAEMEKTVADANMVLDIARNELMAISGLDRKIFNELFLEAKQSAPRAKKEVAAATDAHPSAEPPSPVAEPLLSPEEVEEIWKPFDNWV